MCAAIYQLFLHMVFASRNWFAMQGPVAIILISWNVISKCQKHFYVTHWQKHIFDIFVDTLSLYIFTIWKSLVYNLFCRDGIYFDKILVSEYRFGALKSDSIHHFFRNACTKSRSLRFSQFSGCWLILSVYILMSFDFS
jgi:hypothetical protein